MSLLMIHEACMPVYIVIQIFLAGVHATRGSTRGPRGPKKMEKTLNSTNSCNRNRSWTRKPWKSKILPSPSRRRILQLHQKQEARKKERDRKIKSLPSPDSSTRTRSRRSRGAARRAPASATHFLRSGILCPESLHFLMEQLKTDRANIEQSTFVKRKGRDLQKINSP